MTRRQAAMTTLLATSMFAVGAFALARGQQATGDMSHMHHMAMPKASGVRLEVASDEARHVFTLRLGPLNLPAQAGMNVPQAPDLSWTVPLDGWLVAYHPSLVDASGKPLPGRLLHHVAVYDASRRNYLCPKEPEHIFGAGGEMTDWPATPGLGYRVRQGDKIRVATMFHNDQAVSYPQTYLEIKIDYQPIVPGSPSLVGVRPVWFDVMECGESAYDLKPGHNVTTGEFKLETSGRLIGVGGHMHDYGRGLVLEDATRNQNIATLDAKLDADGRLISIPIALFTEGGGLELAKGDVIRVTAVYENPTGKILPQGAMGIAVGYLVPDGETDSAPK
ncbi:MAG TPA: hypothetical protein VG860_21505 [Terriglobia bacterium]|nr:hypothetical protein [Terriglobia bacterium]